MTGLLLLALLILAVVTVPVAWCLSVALENNRRLQRLGVQVGDLKDAVADLTHLLTLDR